MGSFQIDYDELKIYCHERPEDNRNWWECSITKKESELLKVNKLSAFDLMNDGRECV